MSNESFLVLQERVATLEKQVAEQGAHHAWRLSRVRRSVIELRHQVLSVSVLYVLAAAVTVLLVVVLG